MSFRRLQPGSNPGSTPQLGPQLGAYFNPHLSPHLRQRRGAPLSRFAVSAPALTATGLAGDSVFDENEALAQLALADAADASLMRLVLAAASATLAVALAASLV